MAQKKPSIQKKPFILDPCYDENMPTYAKNKELKKKEFTINKQNITQENGIHVTFMLKMKLQK